MKNKYSVTDYKIIEFHKSDLPGKKYYVMIEGVKNGDKYKVYFGAIKSNGTPYAQFKDSTPLKIYQKYDHNDVARMERYIKRHSPIDTDYISPNSLSYLYLWSE